MNVLTKQLSLIKRRGGLIAHLRLSYRFWQIGRDKYVRLSREKSK